VTETTVVHLMRHGEVHNPTGVLYGRIPDFHLSELGRTMAERVAEHVKNRDIVHLVSSPLERAQETMEPIAKVFAEKFGCKAVAMTFPGRLYLDDASRDWPDDTIHADGTVRTPIWKKGERITPDQYEVVRDASMRLRYGTRTVARAKPGTTFYHRMAAWPVAFEEGMKDGMRRHFPAEKYSIYLTGHSTGGPMVFFMSQRVPNVAGMLAVENSVDLGRDNKIVLVQPLDFLSVQGDGDIAPTETDIRVMPFGLGELANFLDKSQ